MDDGADKVANSYNEVIVHEGGMTSFAAVPIQAENAWIEASCYVGL
jgi:hypothetical protein